MTGCIAELDVPAESFLLSETLATFPDLVAELGLATPQSTTITAYLRASGTDLIAAVTRASTNRAVETIQRVETRDSSGLYRVEWTPDAESPFHGLLPDKARLLYAVGQTDQWEMTVQFTTVDAFDRFQQQASARGDGLQVNHLYRNPGHPDLELTVAQREAVEVAFELGYFEVPRAVSMNVLAEELGVTPNAVSERLRRAERQVFAGILSAHAPGVS